MTFPEDLVFVLVFCTVSIPTYRLVSKRVNRLRRATREELDELRHQISALGQNMEERFADLTLMIDDALRPPIADHSRPADQDEATPDPGQIDSRE